MNKLHCTQLHKSRTWTAFVFQCMGRPRVHINSKHRVTPSAGASITVSHRGAAPWVTASAKGKDVPDAQVSGGFAGSDDVTRFEGSLPSSSPSCSADQAPAPHGDMRPGRALRAPARARFQSPRTRRVRTEYREQGQAAAGFV